jgi:hypothetical protein
LSTAAGAYPTIAAGDSVLLGGIGQSARAMIPPKPATRPSAFAPTARPDDHRNVSAVAAIDARASRRKHTTVVMVNWLTPNAPNAPATSGFHAAATKTGGCAPSQPERFTGRVAQGCSADGASPSMWPIGNGHPL